MIKLKGYPVERQKQEYKRCLERLKWGVQHLGGQLDAAAMPAIAELIIQSMRGRWRLFHTPEHIFEVGDSGDAIEVLAALFHDLVYVQIDQGLSINLSYYLVPYICERDGYLWLRPQPPSDASQTPGLQLIDLVMLIFGLEAGARLNPSHGQNEFLSALIAVQCLEHALPLGILAQIVACIEATIPFRTACPAAAAPPPHHQPTPLAPTVPASPPDLACSVWAPQLPTSCDLPEGTPSGLPFTGAPDRTLRPPVSPATQLFERLEQVSHQFWLDWTEADRHAMVERAVRLANRDVYNFSYPSAADFLDNTWNLLPETNHDLHNINAYSIGDYRRSLMQMEQFLTQLQPEQVFHQYGREPDDQTFLALLQRTRHNLDVALLYLGSKLLAIAILEALSHRLGPQVPLATLMGDLHSGNSRGGNFPAPHERQLELFLPPVVNPHGPTHALEQEVLTLLEQGRGQSSTYDTKNSPVATYVVKSIGFAQVQAGLVQAKAFFHHQITGEDFLAQCDGTVVEAITQAIWQVFESRQAALRSRPTSTNPTP